MSEPNALEQQFQETTERTGEKPSVAICMGMHRAPKPDTVSKFMDTVSHFLQYQDGYDVIQKLVVGLGVPQTRSRMIETMLRVDSCTHLWMVDDDMDWPLGPHHPRNKDGSHILDENDEPVVHQFNPIARMMELDKDIVGALCFTRERQKPRPLAGFERDGSCVYLNDREQIENATPFQCDFVGTGMLLISKAAIQKILPTVGYNHDALFHMFYNWQSRPDIRSEFSKVAERFKSGGMSEQELIDRIEYLQSKSEMMGTDYSFCHRARKAGCEVWCDPGFDVKHIGDYPYGRADWLAVDAYQKEQQAKQESVLVAGG